MQYIGMNADEKLISLIEKYLNGTCTATEKEEVEQWYERIADHQQVYYNADKEEISRAAIASFDKIRNKIRRDNRGDHKIIPINRWYAAAAIILILCVSGLYFFKQYSPDHPNVAKKNSVNPETSIVPGGNQAVLTLGNGQQIILNEAEDGKIAEQSGIRITKTADGRLIYTIAAANHSQPDAPPVYNTITTPRGGQYQIVLPDGTAIWLNAASSLRYPATFDPALRKVELSGEGYFEIAQSKNHKGRLIPFIVKTSHQEVEVLGTHFNINAYADEKATVTTLFEGSVKVHAGGRTVLIAPGDHAVFNGSNLTTGAADIEAAIAWKNGFFFFREADVKTVMRQLSRWYNVEVEYEGDVPVREFSGEIYRNANISQVFDLLTYYKVRYRVEPTKDRKNKIVIIP